jgi:hypothetical protein
LGAFHADAFVFCSLTRLILMLQRELSRASKKINELVCTLSY